MIDRELSLGNLGEGDIFHGECPNGASLICLVTSFSETIIQARTVTSQLHFQFGKRSPRSPIFPFALFVFFVVESRYCSQFRPPG
ncbi:MAG: hypothetical protein P4L43_12725, partial [Syntrophobacteraceae bacterium]|nr:hypothetical protein [Syntrophobacteraceae bacterium]